MISHLQKKGLYTAWTFDIIGLFVNYYNLTCCDYPQRRFNGSYAANKKHKSCKSRAGWVANQLCNANQGWKINAN